MKPTARAFALLMVLLSLVALMLGCDKRSLREAVSNIPPETTLSFAPDAGDTVSYRVRMNWFGWDPDGEVTHYLTKWDSLGWEQTVATDSIFAVPTDDTTGAPGQAYGHHTFSVKAVDDFGDEDPTPASVSFTATNIFPDTELLDGPAQICWPFVSFEWRGTDSDGEIGGYGYRLMIYENDEYVEYESVDSLPPTQTTAEFGPIFGRFRFDIWAIDDQGAVDPSPDQWPFRVWYIGPTRLDVTTNIFNHRTFVEYPWSSSRHQIFEGEHVVFDWTSEGLGIEFRYAYDDTSAWSAWSASNTHFEVTPELGEHEMHIAVRDTFGAGAHSHMLFEVIEVNLDEYVLIVDDYDLWETRPQWGTDAVRDAFYDALVAPFGERYQWDPAEHEGEHGDPMPPDVETLAGASTVVWYCDPTDTEIEDLLGTQGAVYDALGGYVRAGGNLIMCGWEVLSQIAGESYPIDPTVGDETPGKEFISDVLRIGHADHSGHGINPDSPEEFGYCMHGGVPTPQGDALGFEPVYIDSGDCSGEIGRWLYYCEPPPPYPGMLHCGVTVERLETGDGSAVLLYGTDYHLNSAFDGAPSATLYLSGDNRGNVCYIGFPLYFMQTTHAEALIRRALTLFGEEEDW